MTSDVYLPARIAMWRLTDRTVLLTLLFGPGDRRLLLWCYPVLIPAIMLRNR